MRILKRTIALALAASLVIPASSSFAVYGLDENNNQINVSTPNQDDLTIGYSGQDSYQALAAGNWQSTVTKPTSKVSKPDEKNILYSEIVMAVNTSPNVDDVVSAPMPQNDSAQNNVLGEGSQDAYIPPEGYNVIGRDELGYILEPVQDYSVPDSVGQSRAARTPHYIGKKITLEDGNAELELVYEGTYCTIWGEVGDKKFTLDVAKQIAKEYDEKIYPTLTDYFLDESAYDKKYFEFKGIGDGDGKLAIACHEVDKGTYPGYGPYKSGYFSSKDLKGDTASEPIDLVHIRTYPGLTFEPGGDYNPANAYGTFSHELQHLLNYYAYLDYFYSHNGAKGCPTWLNEGMSEASSSLCGYSDVEDRIWQYNGSALVRDGLSFMDWQASLENYAMSSFFTQYMITQSKSGARVFKNAYNSDLYSGWEGVAAFFKEELGLEFNQIIENYRVGLASENSLGGVYNLGSKVTGLKRIPFSGTNATLKGGGAVHNTQYTKATQVEPSDTLKYVGISTGAEYTISAKVSDGKTESTAQVIKAPAGSKVVLTPDLTAGQKVTSYTTSFDSDVNKPTQQANQISFVMPPRNVTVTANVGEVENYTVTVTSENLTIKTADGSDVPATVVDGSDLSMVVTANEGFKCPETVSVKMKGADGEFADLPNTEDSANPEASYYTYAASETEPEKYELMIHKVTGDVEIAASGVEVGNYTITYNLQNLTKNDDAPETVVEGETITFTLTAEENYKLPETIEVLIGETKVTEFDYNRETGVVTIENVTDNVTINAAGITVGQHQVTYTLENLTTNENAPTSVEEGQALTFTLIAEDGYTLPETITVTMGDAVTTGFTYDQTTGVVTVENVTAPIVITANGVAVVVPPTDYAVTYDLENLTVNGPASVSEGETLTATLQAVVDYVLPSSITVTMDGSDVDYNYNPETGVVTVANVTGDVVITAAGVEESGYKITYSLQNIYTNGAPSRLEEGEELSVTLIARTGYSLPETISVTMGGVVLADTDYTYDQATGNVVIPAVTGAVTIQASGVRNYTPNPNPDNSGSGGGIIINGDTSGSSGSSSISDSGSSSSSKPYTETQSKFKSIEELGLGTYKDKASSNVDSKGAVKSSNVVNAVSASNKDVSVKNAKTVTNSILKKMAAKNPDARLVAETTKNGKTVGKLILNAKDSKDYKANLSLNVEVNNKALKSRLVKAFSNNVQSVTLSQGGNFGAEVEVVAKITTTSMDKNNLKFYTYDRDKNTYKEIEVGSYRFDSDGMIHFTTSVGGDILISSGELKKK